MRYRLSVFPILIFIIILYFLYSGLHKDPALIPSPLIGKSIPEFNSTTLFDNKSFSDKDIIGKIFMINVWGSWCYGCSLEHEYLLEIYKKNTIDIYGLNYKDKSKLAINWLKEKGNPYKEVISDNNGDIAIDLGVYGAPESFLVNQKGIIIHKHVDPIDHKYYDKVILPVLKK